MWIFIVRWHMPENRVSKRFSWVAQAPMEGRKAFDEAARRISKQEGHSTIFDSVRMTGPGVAAK
jgi:hypothetical protein